MIAGGIRAALALLISIAVLVPATPAQAHAESGPAATNYRTALTNVSPAQSELTVRVVRGGSRLQLHNGTDRAVTIRGYQDEPYLRLAKDGIFANANAETSYVNEDLPRTNRPKQMAANSTQRPNWQRIGSGKTVVWHDHRTHWMSNAPPAIVDAEPGAPHRLRDWQVPVQVGTDAVTIRGTLDYLPPPQTAVWWAGMLAAAGLIVLIGLWRFSPMMLSGVLAVTAGAELVDGLGRVRDGGAHGFTHILADLVTTETYGLVTAVAALIAAGFALWRRAAAPIALALGGSCLAVLGALTDVTVFAAGRATTSWDPTVARFLTAATLAGATAVAVSGWWRVARDLPTPVEPTDGDRTHTAAPTGAAA